jgi:hypothetical protein
MMNNNIINKLENYNNDGHKSHTETLRPLRIWEWVRAGV